MRFGLCMALLLALAGCASGDPVADAQRRAAVANAMRGVNLEVPGPVPRREMNCTSQRVGDTVQTNCQ